ncbi:hypothetical protein ACQPYE_04535 [Actinosynnema sp. CA-299493]
MSSSRPLSGHSGTARPDTGVQAFPPPGEWHLSLPKNLLAEAPWLVLVLTAFAAGWTPGQITLLVLALTPLMVLRGAAKRV